MPVKEFLMIRLIIIQIIFHGILWKHAKFNYNKRKIGTFVKMRMRRLNNVCLCVRELGS